MALSFLKIIFFMFAGWAFAHRDRYREQTSSFLNKYLYYLGLPAIIIHKVSLLDATSLSGAFLAVNTIPIIAVSIILFIFWKVSILSVNQTRTLLIVSVLGNTVYLGLPAVAAFLGEEYIGYAALVSAAHNLVIFTFCLIIMNLISEDKFAFSSFIKHTVKNPVLDSSFLGLGLAFLSIRPSGFPAAILSEISATVIPLSLIALGFSLYGRMRFMGRIKLLSLAAALKLIVLPFLSAFLIYITQGLEPAFKVSFIQHTMPTAVMAYIVAKEMELDDELTSQTIVFTTLIYFLLIPVYNVVMKLLF
ncbi:MAG: AEC family transporter [Elusimicrobiota bacterium]